MQLHGRSQGTGPPLVLLHGLFGSNENLGGVARALADTFSVHALDLRNHGRSPHGAAMDYATLTADVAETADGLCLERFALLGHSLGGNTAMELALSHPQRVARLVVVDIAPVAHDRHHDQELEALHALDLEGLRNRAEADAALAPTIPNPAVRQFLLKNLVRADGGFAWRIPLETIYREYDHVAAAPPSPGPWDGPALFIRGGASDYVDTDGERAIRERFPNARIETIDGAAHWVHVEAPEAFLALVRGFLED